MQGLPNNNWKFSGQEPIRQPNQSDLINGVYPQPPPRQGPEYEQQGVRRGSQNIYMEQLNPAQQIRNPQTSAYQQPVWPSVNNNSVAGSPQQPPTPIVNANVFMTPPGSKLQDSFILPPAPVFSSGMKNTPSSNPPLNPHIKSVQIPAQQNKIQYPQLFSIHHSKSLGASGTSVKSHNSTIFNDDHEIINKKTPFKDQHISPVKISLKSQYKIVRLGPKTILPAMCSVHTEGKNRTSTDLICVIDTSGSMAGAKINLVIDTLLYLLKLLDENDRLCLITFNNNAERICPLMTVSAENKPKLADLIKQMCVSGGTNIMQGINYALKILKQRRYVNAISSIFLLSDGQDVSALPLFKQTLADTNTGVFSLHAFGFGDDHDPILMKEMAKIKQGNFYYIQQLSRIDEAFVNAIGALFSISIEKLKITMKLIPSGKFSGITIGKLYGGMWKKENNQYKIELTQLISETSKDFVFEIEIPQGNFEIGDFERNQTIIEAKFQAITPEKQILKGESILLNLTFFNHYESLAILQENTLVTENYLRVKAAECMDVSMELANNKKYSEARQHLERMAEQIRTNKSIDQSKVKTILEDLRKVIETCVQSKFETVGLHLVNCVQYQHMAQNNMSYSNFTQTRMNTQLEQLKQLNH